MSGSTLKKYLQGHKLEVVNQALDETFGNVPVGDTEYLNKGLTDALVFKITVDGKKYILKLIINSDPLIPAHSSYAAMKIAAVSGIAPKVLYCNENEGIYIADYIEAKFIPDYFHSLQDFYSELAGTIRGIHNLPAFPKAVNFFDGIDQVRSTFNNANILPASVTEEHFMMYSEIKRVYKILDTDLVPSHNDLNPGNLRYDGKRFWVIDWDAAFQNDRYVDLAVVAKFFVFNDHQEELFLQAYFGKRVDEKKRSRFFLMQQVCYIYYAMVILLYAEVARTPDSIPNDNMETPRVKDFIERFRSGELTLLTYEDQVLYGKAFFNEALHNMKLKRFEESLIVLKNSSGPD